MGVPVGKNLESVGTGILQGSKLVFRCKGEVFGRMVYVLHPVVLRHHIVFSQQVTARLVGCVLLCLLNEFLNNVFGYRHDLSFSNVQCFKSQAACS